MLHTKVPFIGRDVELDQLEHALKRAAEGHGTLALLSGEAGIGKTRLCQEIRRSHERRRGEAAIGQGFPEDAGITLGPIVDTLRRARRAHARLWEAARSRAGLLAAIVPELVDEPRPTGRSFDRPVIFETLLDAVEESADDRVALWILEDIHWADDSSWEFVKYTLRRLLDMRLLVVATYREEEVGPSHAWWARLAWLQRDPSVLAIRLGRLGAADIELLIRSLAPSLSDELVASVLERSAGTPLLAEELVSLALRRGDIEQVPDVVRATVRERASRLEPASRELLELASVAGLDVDADLLESLRPRASHRDLVSAGFLLDDGETLRFRHPLLQEAAYEDIPRARRKRLHEEVAEAAVGRKRVEKAGLNFEKADNIEAALSTLEAGAAQARGEGNVGRAASLDLAALALAGRHDALADRIVDLARTAIGDLFRAGRWTDLDPLAREAWSKRDFMQPDERAWLANVVGLHLFWSGSIREAWEMVQEEISHMERVGALEGAAMLLAQVGFIAWFRGDTDRALPLAERALGAARGLGDPEAECRARNVHYLATYQLDRDRLDAAARHRENAALARANGLTFAEANSLWSLSHYTVTLEDYEAAEEAAERAGTWYAGPARLLKGFMHLIEGRADEAERIFVRIGPEIRLGIPAMAYWMDVKEAWLYLHRGNLDQARSRLEERSETEGARLVLWVTEASATRGWLAWEEGNFKEAADHFDRAMDEWPLGAYHIWSADRCFFHCKSTRSSG